MRIVSRENLILYERTRFIFYATEELKLNLTTAFSSKAYPVFYVRS